MADARTPGPSRIGKTLGAILSTSRRGASDADAGDRVEEGAPKPDSAGASAPTPEPVARPSTSRTIELDAPTPERRADGPTGGAPIRATSVEPSPVRASNAGSVRPTPAPSDVDVTLAEPTDEGVGSRRKKRETFLIPEELADAMRNAIVHLSGPPLYYTLAEFGEHAIRNYIAQLEREHNGGQSFPRRPRAVRQGRPLR